MPIKPLKIMLGKLAPYGAVGQAQTVIIIIIIIIPCRPVRLRGSAARLAGCAGLAVPALRRLQSVARLDRLDDCHPPRANREAWSKRPWPADACACFINLHCTRSTQCKAKANNQTTDWGAYVDQGEYLSPHPL
ncbi:hypothetical protein [Rhizobium halophytocola]|uniref:Uncharacterized protein n=1 Tax=Rhizobium halophytocola TaxID=735519 RepID=A0ABS4DTD1_9HYPH|nr:hypothetical protein [Rhizobium halophytocola]MBP1848948.1 hypothetical protein [Rhizobium halophytocola]